MVWTCSVCEITLKHSTSKSIDRHNSSARHAKQLAKKEAPKQTKTNKTNKTTKTTKNTKNTESDQKSTNETFGITCEKIICDIHQVLFPSEMKRRVVETRFTTQLKKNLEAVLKTNGLVVEKYSGNTDDKVDFILTNGKTLSVKTNLQSDKVCPQIIGQTTRKKFCSYFNIFSDSQDVIKEWIFDNHQKILEEYFRHTFCCDYLLWVNEQTAECKLISKPKTIRFNNTTFTRSLDKWNESNTVKIQTPTNKCISLGEFQLHRNRNCIKFRFNLMTLIKLISG
jgi:hypothetical protein